MGDLAAAWLGANDRAPVSFNRGLNSDTISPLRCIDELG
jgi:hypothetical protein